MSPAPLLGTAVALLAAATAAAGASQLAFVAHEGADRVATLLFLLVFPLTWAYAFLEHRITVLADAPAAENAPEPFSQAILANAQDRTFLATLSLFATIACCVLAMSDGRPVEKIVLLVIAVALFLTACRPTNAFQTASASIQHASVHWLEIAAVLSIVAVAAFVRLYHRETFPFGMHGDEGEFGSAALHLMMGEPLEIFGSGVFLQHPNVYAYLLAGSMHLFGVDFAGARALSGLTGAATVLALYGLVRTALGVRVAIPAAAFLALAPWHLTFSRMAMNDILVPFFLTTTIFFLSRGLRSQTPSPYALAGVSCGLGWWMDYNNKSVILCLVVAGSALYLMLTRWRRWRAELPLGLVFAAGIVVVMAPVLTTAFRNEQLFRFAEVARESSFVLQAPPADQPPEDAPTAPATPLRRTANKVARSVFAFNYFGDTSPFNAGNATPVLDGVTAVFFFIGLAYAMWRWLDPRYALLVIWWILALSPDIWGLDSPQAHHLLPAVIPACALAAVGLTKVAGAWAAALQWSRPMYGAISTAILVMVISYLNVVRYFFPEEADRSWMFHVTAGRAIRELAPGHAVYFIGPPAVYSGHGVIRFTSREAPVTDVENVHDVVPLAEPPAHDLYFLFTPTHFEDIAFVRETYPNGTLREWKDGESEPYLIGYEVRRTALAVGEQPLAEQ